MREQILELCSKAFSIKRPWIIIAQPPRFIGLPTALLFAGIPVVTHCVPFPRFFPDISQDFSGIKSQTKGLKSE